MTEIDQQSWKKMQDIAIKAGYRDGISDGRESNFQESFDKGYESGFKVGFALGLYKGILTVVENDKFEDENLQKTSRGHCQMCANENLAKETITELKDFQMKSASKLLSNLSKKYSQIDNYDLPKYVENKNN